jgi:hypothetical protein
MTSKARTSLKRKTRNAGEKKGGGETHEEEDADGVFEQKIETTNPRERQEETASTGIMSPIPSSKFRSPAVTPSSRRGRGVNDTSLTEGELLLLFRNN